MSPIPSRRRVLRYIGGVVALAFAGATCKDLTGPTGLAADGGQVVLTYMGARGSTGAVELTAGDTVAPPVEVRIDGVVVTRARYVFTVRDTAFTGPADDIVKVEGGDTLVAVNRGRAKLIATLVGATIGGKIDPTDKIADTVDVVVSPAANGLNVARLNLNSIGETLAITAFSTDANGARVRLGRVDWSSSAPGVLSVSAGATAADTNVATLTAVGNGTATITALFDSVQTVTRTFIVQQRLHHYRLASASVVNGEITLASLHDSAFVNATPLDSLGVALTAGSQAPQPLNFTSSAPDRAGVNAVTGTIEALLNTDASVPALVYGTIGGTSKSDTLRVRVAQVAVSLTIIGKRIDTIPSIGATKDLAAIVKDARGNDIQTGITWLPKDVAVARYQSLPTDQLVAVDTGTTYVRASRDQQRDSIRVSVTNNPETVVLTPDTLYLRSINEVKRFTDIVLRNSKGDRLTSGIPITWSSSNTSVVQARADSTMLAVGVGAADVTATTPNGKVATSRVVVTNAPASIDITPTSATLASVGDTLLNVPVTITNGVGATLPRSAANWTTDNSAVATVAVDASANVYIVATGAGIAHIRAASPLDPNVVNDEVVVTVTNAATTITVSPSAPGALTSLGSTLAFSATVLNQANRPISGAQVTWSVLAAGAGVLSIDPNTGVATALANGSATVRATSGGVTQDVAVTVAQAVSTARSTIVPAATTLAADGASSTTVTVQLKDANDNNVVNATPTPVLATSLGSLSAVSAAGNGAYTATLTAGTVSGAANITGTVGGLAIANSGSVAFTSGAATKYIVTPNSLTPAAGTAVTVRAQLADANNNPIATAGNAVQFSSTNGGSFTPANGQATTDATGAATITFTTSTTVTSHTITATTGSVTGASQPIVTTSGAGTNYLVTTSSANPAAGSTVTISAQLRDANNNPVALQGQTVTWTKSNPNGSFPGGATDASTTNASGVATITLTTHTIAGTATTVTATTGSVTGTSGTITTVPGAAAQMALNGGNGQTANAGAAVAIAPSVLVTDANGNAVVGLTVNFAVASGGGSGTGLIAATNASGVATAGSWTLGSSIGPNTMTATVLGVAGSPVTFSATSLGTASLSVTQNGSESGPTSIVYTVTLNAPNTSGAPITFDVANSGGSATSGSDFTAFGGAAAISVANGASSGSLTVSVINDALVEGAETVQATISAPSNAAVTIANATATANLLDNDGATAGLSVTTQGAEGGAPTSIVYTVTLSSANNTGTPITFDVANSGGTASSGNDFTAFGGVAAISVANGATTGTLTVPVIDDALLEGAETVQATISNASDPQVTITAPTAVANIVDDESASAALSATTQGDETGPVAIVYTVTLSTTNNTGAPITFTAAHSGGTATSGSDFTPFGGAAAISVANGANTGTLTVAVQNDALLEGAETVQATISSPSLAAVSITTATATASISDDETATAALSVTQHGNEAGPTNIVYTVTLSAVNNSGAPVTFDVSNSGGSATSGSDFTAFGGTAAISVPVGSSTGTLSVSVLDDALLEPTETVQATISGSSNAAVSITGASATANLVDNETTTASLSTTQHGDEAGLVSIQYTVTLSRTNNTGAPITFTVTNSGGTATSGSDFTAFGGAAAISVADGASTGTLTVTVLQDALLEGTETVQATISAPSFSGVTIGTATATANIADDETATADLSVTQQGNEAGPQNIVYTVTLSAANNSGAPVTFAIANSGGTATSGTDFTAFGGTISVANGASTGTLTVPVLNDARLESTETVQATISTPSLASVSIGVASATANILEEGGTATLSVTQTGVEATTPTSVVYTVSLSKTNNTGSAITFDVTNTAGGTATSGVDYTAFGGAAAVSVANGASTGTLTVTVLNDAVLEATETVIATISNASNAGVSIAGASATASILDNETASAALSVTQNGNETGTVSIVYTVTLSRTNNSGAPITFAMSNTGGTATSGSDFTAFDGPAAISVANGASTGTLTVPVTDDALLEPTETVEASISDPSLASVSITTPTATANILESGDIATLSIPDAAEGTNLVATVSLTKQNVTGAGISFSFARTGGTSTAGVDHGAVAATITIANGATSGSANISTVDDALLENDETFSAQISSPSNPKVTFGVGTDAATANILETGATATLSATSPTEGTDIVFTVTLSKQNVTGSAVDFTFAKTGGTSVGADYGAVPATISVANNQSSGTANLTTNDDALLENDETFDAQISAPTNADVTFTTGSDATTATINESGATATLSASSPTEGSDIVFTVTLSKQNVTGSAVSFTLADAGTGSATAADYGAVPASVSVANGASSGTANLTTVDDNLLELDETFDAQISAPSNGDVTFTAGSDQATATIVESGATVELVTQTDGAENPNQSIVYRVELMHNGSAKTNVTGSAITVDYSDATVAQSGTATVVLDYLAFTGTATIADGTGSTTFSVAVVDDVVPEAPTLETVFAQIANLSGPASVTLGTALRSATIASNE